MAGGEQVRFARGDVLLDPTDRGYTADMRDCAFALLRVPRAVWPKSTPACPPPICNLSP
jgi:hypothetical protein